MEEPQSPEVRMNLRRLSEYRALASNREPTPRLPFLNEKDKSPFLANRSYLLVAMSKLGKTSLMVRIAMGWSEYEVLWISEEGQGFWEDRSLKLDSGGENIMICHAMGLSPKQISTVVEETEWDILVIDTVKLLQIADENDAAEVSKKLRPFLKIQQEQGKIAIFLHHSRKAGGTFGLGAAGSHAFMAVIDNELEISRHPSVGNQRRLTGYGRETIESLVYEMTREGEIERMSVVPEQGKVSERLMEVIASEWQSTKELAELLDPEPKDAGRALKTLAKQGKVERRPPLDEGTKQGKVYSWRTAE